MGTRSVSKAPARSYQICTRCVMDTSDPWIYFDGNGICNHCTDYLQSRLAVTAYSSPSSDSTNFWNSVPRSSGPYDVLVGISGGVDSSFVAVSAANAGLRVLALHLDNGWDTPTALRNVYQLSSLPGISYEAEVLDWANFRSLQRAFISAGVPDIELPTDIAIQASLHRAAVRHGIRVILSGGNIASEGILPASWMYNPRDSCYGLSILKSAGLSATSFNSVKFGFRQELTCRLYHRIRTLYPLNHIRYDKELARDYLVNQIGWQSYGGKHCESTYTRFCQLIYQPKRHSIDYRRCHLSADICLGKITRTQALTLLLKDPWADLDVENDVNFVARKLDYLPSEIYAAMSSPPLWYIDYPHREHLLQFAYATYRTLTGRTKTSNF